MSGLPWGNKRFVGQNFTYLKILIAEFSCKKFFTRPDMRYHDPARILIVENEKNNNPERELGCDTMISPDRRVSFR